MADENEMADGNDGGAQGGNSYFGAFAGIVDALDAIAQAVAPGGADGGEPPAGPQRPDGDIQVHTRRAGARQGRR